MYHNHCNLATYTGLHKSQEPCPVQTSVTVKKCDKMKRKVKRYIQILLKTTNSRVGCLQEYVDLGLSKDLRLVNPDPHKDFFFFFFF